MSQYKFSERSEAFCQDLFQNMFDTSDAIYGILISTVDGHDVSKSFSRDMPAAKLSAMMSAILALGETIAVEAEQQQCRYVIVENSDGYILTLKIKDKLILSVIATTQANLGMLHSVSRNAAEKLAAQLR
ncbi:roadblock/LC7 domain-containing protein [Marinobacter daepoensis]|uniref:Roadblock/LC7 domain-containing protein n=1 Tax=Marinobacter daepoensis TaxID=262077 RepID=A0ABS3BIC5_9GAMM|nr:roadblock/LC7 domain-containing protein [Marinobacter daepoensis]MBN7771512.1 roadblock/LC7 domain-containing protein [Marinobacter daepoensis]MBY6034218.1 roadblock/LC7 domain-containing protein [Marinobacter daepoensis]MBY6080112.1 roadblock/LC7 domain-containing protein [Marinobacter daepoensis]